MMIWQHVHTANWPWMDGSHLTNRCEYTRCSYLWYYLTSCDRDEHYSRSPDCAFFTLISNYKQEPPSKKSKSKRISKASRLSTQSVLTVASEVPSEVDPAAEEDDSILTTATNTTSSKKMSKTKKVVATKAKKTRAKKGEPVEVVMAPEHEDNEFEVKVDTTPKPSRGRKRKSDQEDETSTLEVEAPPAKRRTTRTKGSTAVIDSVIGNESPRDIPKPVGRKGRPSKGTRKASVASIAPSQAPVLDDEELEQALEADLQRPLSDDEGGPRNFKRSTRQNKITNADHAMFNTEPLEIDEEVIEAELQAMEVVSKTLPKAKGGRPKQPRKVSAKQQASAAKKAAEERIAEAEAQRLAEEEAAQQITAELEHSISMQHSSPVIQPKRQRAPQRPAKQASSRPIRESVMSIDDDVDMAMDQENLLVDEEADSGHETDASMASQSTVVRGGSTRRGSTLKKAKARKNAVTKNMEENTHQRELEPVVTSPKGKEILYVQEMEHAYPELVEEGTVEALVEKPMKSKTTKAKGRPQKASVASSIQIRPSDIVQSVEQAEPAAPTPVQYQAPSPPRLSSPPPKDLTPSQSPQSSDAENHPPSSKPSAATKKAVTPQPHTRRIPLADSTPMMSPSKRNVIAGLQTTRPWSSIDLDLVFMKSPGNGSTTDVFGAAMDKVKNGETVLTSPEKKMSVEEWIKYNAELAEDRLRSECERMVGAFEKEGTRAMAALEGVECLE
jgi:hypothetical protein